ncbi:hypothetical protein FRC02_010928 [Tulasnella sp. 418]|nr:hypothetical protein FRC02_010928 [Tulasnella sp. 418]
MWTSDTPQFADELISPINPRHGLSTHVSPHLTPNHHQRRYWAKGEDVKTSSSKESTAHIAAPISPHPNASLANSPNRSQPAHGIAENDDVEKQLHAADHVPPVYSDIGTTRPVQRPLQRNHNGSSQLSGFGPARERTIQLGPLS